MFLQNLLGLTFLSSSQPLFGNVPHVLKKNVYSLSTWYSFLLDQTYCVAQISVSLRNSFLLEMTIIETSVTNFSLLLVDLSSSGSINFCIMCLTYFVTGL